MSAAMQVHKMYSHRGSCVPVVVDCTNVTVPSDVTCVMGHTHTLKSYSIDAVCVSV